MKKTTPSRRGPTPARKRVTRSQPSARSAAHPPAKPRGPAKTNRRPPPAETPPLPQLTPDGAAGAIGVEAPSSALPGGVEELPRPASRELGTASDATPSASPGNDAGAPGFVELPNTPGDELPAGTPGDVEELILRDHRPLKSLIATMQNYGLGFDERHEAFERFAPLLTRHARAEEQVLYAFLKSDDRLREDGLQGDVEHALADQLIEALEGTTDLELYSARLKVLAELVGHHLQAEERALLPHVKQHLEPGEREAMGRRYLELRESLSPDEARLGAPGAEGPNAAAARAELFDSGPERELATEVDQDEPPDERSGAGSNEAGVH